MVGRLRRLFQPFLRYEPFLIRRVLGIEIMPAFSSRNAVRVTWHVSHSAPETCRGRVRPVLSFMLGLPRRSSGGNCVRLRFYQGYAGYICGRRERIDDSELRGVNAGIPPVTRFSPLHEEHRWCGLSAMQGRRDFRGFLMIRRPPAQFDSSVGQGRRYGCDHDLRDTDTARDPDLVCGGR